jgi:hypothetical protein
LASSTLVERIANDVSEDYTDVDFFDKNVSSDNK